MNWTQIKGRWTELEGHVRSSWGKLTRDDLTTAEGDAEELVGLLMVRYGITKQEAERQVDEWADKVEELLVAADVARAEAEVADVAGSRSDATKQPSARLPDDGPPSSDPGIG